MRLPQPLMAPADFHFPCGRNVSPRRWRRPRPRRCVNAAGIRSMSCSSPATPTSIIPASPWRSWRACWRRPVFASPCSASPTGTRASRGGSSAGRGCSSRVSAGNMDSLINHYTANKKVRNDDAYSPGGRIGLRPDRATLALLPSRPRGVSRRAGHRRRRRGVAAAPGPLRLLERHRPPLDPARLQGRPGGLRHGRADDRRDRPAPGGGADGARSARPARRGLRAGSQGI